MLFEDAFVLRDPGALTDLFDRGAVLVRDERSWDTVRREGIEEVVAGIWDAGITYFFDSQRIVQSGDTALVIGVGLVNVMHRGTDGFWRYSICVLGTRCPGRGRRERGQT